MTDEKKLLAKEWLGYAKDDLESAKVILKETENYHISVYHSHQAIEKIFKWFLLKNNKNFPFIHDIKELFRLVCKVKQINKDLLDGILYIDNLYPQLRYPTGEEVIKDDAQYSLTVAQKIFKVLTEE